MLLESGPASGDRNRYLIIFVMTLAFGLYFFYDGTWGYLNKNRKEAIDKLPTLTGLSAEQLPKEFGDTPTKPLAEAVIDEPPSDPAVLREKFGNPLHIAPGLQGETREFYASDYGLLDVKLRFGRVVPEGLTWTKWAKTKEEIQYQYYWGTPCLLIAIYALFRVIGLLRLKVTMDEEKLVYAGASIPYSAMQGFDNYSPKGWVDLLYGEVAKSTLRLDNYRVEKYDEILDIIVARTELDDPRPAKTPATGETGETTEGDE